MQFDLDPSPTKAAIVAICLFFESFIGAMIVICQGGDMPTTLEAFTALLVACLVLITYVLTFLRTSEATP